MSLNLNKRHFLVDQMCYSANVSFAAAAVLVVMGSLLVRRVKDKHSLPLALIPFFFALQQISEGLLWDNVAPQIAKWIFLIFAFVVWPLWIPYAFWFVEEKGSRKQGIAFCGGGLDLWSLLSWQ